MTAENVGHTAGLSVAGFARWGAGPSKRERNFYIALACAVILHASFFINAAQNGGAQRLGAEKGADDAISVSLVTEQDLQSRATVADQASPPPGPVAPTQEKQQAKPQPQKPQEKQQPTPPPEQAKQEPQPPQPQQPPPEPQAQDTPQPPDTQPDLPQDADPAKPEPEPVTKQEDAAPDSKAPDLFSLDDQDPSKMQSDNEPKAKPKPKQEPKHETKRPSTSKSAKKSSKAQKELAALDLSTQALSPSFSGGGGAAAFQRPPGITRSGLNDAFARAVIRALQQTMPQLANTLGRVTVRIFLSDSGNVIDVKLLAGSKDPSLNQDVVFAAKQTSYPIPPAGSNVADRTFMVTYIYD